MKEYMNDVSVVDAIKAGRKDSICWDCKKAMRGGCSWSDTERFEPVEGWTAIGNQEDGYTVFACPQFVRETYGCGRYRTADDYILALQIGLTDRLTQISRMKKRFPNMQKKIEDLRKQNAKLQDTIDREAWQISVHMSD